MSRNNPFNWIPGPCSHCGGCAPLRTPAGASVSWDGICESCDMILTFMSGGKWHPWAAQFEREYLLKKDREARVARNRAVDDRVSWQKRPRVYAAAG